MLNIDKINFGRESEKIVLEEYLKNEYIMVAENFQYYAKGRPGRRGEIDLIFKKDKILVLVEVKARKNQRFGSVFEQISYSKIQTLKKVYSYFIACNPEYRYYYVRVDLACIYKGLLTVIDNAMSFE